MARPEPSNDDTHATDQWFPAKGAARAVALVLHGLNFKPARMESICRCLAGLGVESHLVVFTGHDGDLAALRAARRESFLADAARGYDEASRRAAELGVPMLLAGFSLGAVVGNYLLHAREDARFAAMVLFAPAFTPRAFTHAIRLLSPAPRLLIRSASPSRFRANDATSVSAYRALFDSIAALRAHGYARSNLPCVVFIDPRDELVSARGLRRLIRDRNLDQWTLVEVSNAGTTLERTLHHLIVGPEEVGAAQWSRIEACIALLLDKALARAA
ncbi:MAG: alpha/beta hydrolase [Myxococcales bacterium]|jgi:pimeloyl-ACP methyl ester carboxylesterase